MPSRTKVDTAAVIAAYVAHGSRVSETARSLGLHYNTVNQIVRNMRGMCMRCGARPHQPGQTKCVECAKWGRERTARKRAEARASQRCSMCPEPLTEGSALYCVEHYRMTKRRQRHHAVMRKFGDAGLKVWNERGRRCEACGAGVDDARIRIHHIDEDWGNQAESNYALLCHDCHWLVHRLINSRDRRGVIRWFEKTYPDKPLRNGQPMRKKKEDMAHGELDIVVDLSAPEISGIVDAKGRVRTIR